MAGGLLAFLLYNHYPAKVFMGDTGSLFLGGAVAALAFAYDMPLVLIPVGIVYICETLSDILQVGYFKLTHGKRIFKMAPLHHHFEMCGWKETKIVAVFTTVSVIFCALAYGRYEPLRILSRQQKPTEGREDLCSNRPFISAWHSAPGVPGVRRVRLPTRRVFPGPWRAGWISRFCF